MNKDWNTYKNNWQNTDGLFNKISNVFNKPTNNVINSQQIQILRNWNNAVTHGCTNQATFNRIIASADQNTRAYFSNLNKGRGSIEGLRAAQNSATTSTIGLTVATTALNMAITMGLMLAIQATIKGFDQMINSAKRASEAADEAFSNSNEKVKNNEKELRSLSELISKYKELNSTEILDLEGRTKVKELQNDIADLVGTQAKNLDLVNGKLDEEILKLNKISKESAKTAYESAVANYYNSQKANEKATGDAKELFFDGYAYVGKKEKEPEKILGLAGYKGNVRSGGISKLYVTDALDNNMRLLVGAQEKADYLQGMIDVLEQNGQRATDIYAGLIKQRDIYLKYIDNQQAAANDLISSWISYNKYTNNELLKINVNSVDSFKIYRQKMIEEVSKDDSISSIIADGLLSDDVIRRIIDDYMSTCEEFSTWFDEWKGNIKNTGQDETPISFTDSLSQIQSLSEGLEQLDSIYADVYDKEGFDWSSILNNEKFQETFSELGTIYENFISTVSNTPDDISSCQDAFDDLATSYIFHSGALDNVTESTKAATIAMLEEQGIANATQLIENALAVNKQFLAKTGIDLANATYEDINAFLQEQGVASSTKQALAEYQLQKELASGITLDTSGDIENLYNLVSACGSAASALQTLYKIKSGNLYGVDANGNRKNGPGISQSDYQKILSDAEMEINNAALGIKAKNKIAYNGGATTKKAVEDANKAAKSGQKEAESTWKDFLDKQLTLYKAELDAGLISLQEYLDKSKSLLDNFYAEGKISGAEYWSSMKSMYENQSAIYDKVLSAVQRRIDKEVDGINDIIDGLEKQNEVLEKQKDNYDAVLSSVNDLIESKQDKIQESIDKLNKENDGIEDLISNYDSVLSVVENVYDKEITGLEDQQKAIDDKIKSLQDENDERKLAIKLEQAKYALYKSMNQRNVKLFNGTEFIYTTNQDDIRQNQENMADLTLEQTVNGLEKEKDALQNSIDELQKYKEMWLEASNARKKALDEQIAKDLLGNDYESLILKNRIQDIEDFKNKYIEAQQRLEDNTTLVESYDEKNEYYDKLKEKWSSLTSAKEKAANKQLAIDILGKDWESAILSDRNATFENFKLKYLEIQSQIEDNTSLIESYNEKLPYYEALKAQWSSISSAYKNSMEDQHAAMVLGQGWEANVLNGRLETLTSFRNSYIKTQQDIADSAWRAANEQINAAKAASQAANGNTGSAGSVGNPTTTPTQVKTPTNTKNPTTVTGGHIGAWVKPNTISKYANGGVVSDKDSNELDPIAKSLGEDHLVAVRNYERIIPDEKWDMLREQLMIHPVIAPDLIPKTDMLKWVTNNNNNVTNVNVGDIHLNNVQDTDTLSRAIIRELPNKLVQAKTR